MEPQTAKILALETATEGCSAALWVDGTVTQRFEVMPRAHARLILPMMDALLAEAGLTLKDLDALAFGRGPGAFTGVRVAVGVVQGAAFAADRPVVPVSTLAALAQQAVDAGASRVLAALDARMGEVYWGAFEAREGLARAVAEECVCPPEAVPVPAVPGWTAVGRGWTAYGEALLRRLEGRVDALPQADCIPRAAEVARLAVGQWAQGRVVSAESALPVYLRDRVAEPPREAR
ncbi:tRNA (adenosine(37)-N6)-threonylcarbamoyltransferase complex dimerization subunit type 1 TsaB [Ectothiorhodospira mobilis]|uniref:tRNA (adenosine(37)-N6)-threonylcarbamoyltransferase complex dimerization subunit type 1 TsaB n=1 Tax=Ectothiorhodospira mobilis TaxID=195064 RepID=UPI001EE7FD7D|nr:tRNA (adenosine(37)-N6)-threonylcarbamoyltransferase complex dimerization subunit type 1 TsaB [Ectothiorhodospira mobilis]MCG5536095.1 tRNA (adenosine(37)-N6)-threonylcarbamoyltransferase complex dimerization subunit type 1 TsaB [Ectothiorhodospira mobilis]